MTQQGSKKGLTTDAAELAEKVGKITGNPKAQEIADRSKEFHGKWNTGGLRPK